MAAYNGCAVFRLGVRAVKGLCASVSALRLSQGLREGGVSIAASALLFDGGLRFTNRSSPSRPFPDFSLRGTKASAS
jgi:hypothetical protein